MGGMNRAHLHFMYDSHAMNPESRAQNPMKRTTPTLIAAIALPSFLLLSCGSDTNSSLDTDAPSTTDAGDSDQSLDSRYPEQPQDAPCFDRWSDSEYTDQSQDVVPDNPDGHEQPDTQDPPDPITVYPEPAKVGFHHAALIYGRKTRSSDDLLLYAAHIVDGKPKSWLFDAFLFLLYTTPAGNRTEIGPTYKADWEAHWDAWFAPGRDLAALDDAIERAAKTLGPPPSKRKIILSIPYPNPNVTDFGDVNGDGKTENLSRAEDVDRVLNWYLAGSRQRFNNAGFKHLELWGGYWMNETVNPVDHRNCRSAADWLHSNSLRFLWIPYSNSQGHSEWEKLGFDLALLQPNYAFWERHNGTRRRNWLRIAADRAQQYGMGIEIEMSGSPSRRPGDMVWGHYLRDGSSDRGGYQKGATAYYLSTDNIENLARSTNMNLRSLYDDLAVYISGKRVKEPDRALSWVDQNAATVNIDSSGWRKPVALKHAQSTFPETLTVADLTVYIDEPEDNPAWTGMARAEYLVPGTTTWRPAGWALRALRNQSHKRHQVMTLPIGRAVDGLRITFEDENASLPNVTGLAPLERGPLPDIDNNIALGLPYVFEPTPAGTYPDRGSQLNDTLISQQGYTDKRAVGWQNGKVAIQFDLGTSQPIEKVRMHVQGGGRDGVNWPAESVLLLGSSERPVQSTSGFSHHGEPAAWSSPQAPVIDKTVSSDVLLGHIDYQLKPNSQARFVTLIVNPLGWLMISEIEVFSNTTNIAPKATYKLSPPPTGASSASDPYPDDGVRLTSGNIATSYGTQTTGWRGPEPRTITVDLQKKHPLSEVTIWSLSTREAGITGLKTVEIQVSDDALTWRNVGVAAAGTAPAHLEGAEPYRLQFDQQARLVRARITAGSGWAMVSQIEVKPK